MHYVQHEVEDNVLARKEIRPNMIPGSSYSKQEPEDNAERKRY